MNLVIPTAVETTLLPFLPTIYVAWSDGSFTDQDLRELRERVRELDADTREMLLDWLDPANPPRVGQLKLMLFTIRQMAGGLSSGQRLNLAQLGLEMARRSHAPSQRTIQALEELEEALGVAGAELARELLPQVSPSPETPPSSFDRSAMQDFLDGAQREHRQEMRRWLGEPVFTRQYGLDLDSHRELVWGWCQELARRGLTRLVTEDLPGMLASVQTLGYFDNSLLIKLGVQVGLFGGSLLHLGTERHQELARQAILLELPGCFAMSERDHGSNVKDIETTARFDPLTDEFIIHTPHEGARKEWIGNAARHGRMATVFAQLQIGRENYGVHAFLVGLRDEQGRLQPGVRIEDCGHKLGLNGVDNGKIWFQNVRIPRDNMLDRHAQVDRSGHYTSSITSSSKRFFTMIGTLVMGRVSLCLAALSAIRLAVALAVEYADKRRQFGPAGQAEMVILDYQTHQKRLMPALATAYALEFTNRFLVERYLQGTRSEDEARELEVLAAGLKATASWDAMQILQTCRECCGGNGYLAANRFADLKADLDVFTTFEGDNTVLMQLVARGLLTSYRQQFSELKFAGVLKYLAHQAGRVLVPLSRGGSLKDPLVQRNLFKAREEQLLVSVAKRLKAKIDGGSDSYHAFVDCQDHLLALSRAYIERVIVEQFQRGVEEAPVELRAALKDLCDLYVMSRLHQDRAWFLEHGHFEPSRSKMVRDTMLELCLKLRADAVPLVRAFNIPAKLLAVPMLA